MRSGTTRLAVDFFVGPAVGYPVGLAVGTVICVSEMRLARSPGQPRLNTSATHSEHFGRRSCSKIYFGFKIPWRH